MIQDDYEEEETSSFNQDEEDSDDDIVQDVPASGETIDLTKCPSD